MQMGRHWPAACIQFAVKVGELATRPVAIGPVKAVCNAYTACVQGEVVEGKHFVGQRHASCECQQTFFEEALCGSA
jgi:hypothetical protein